VYHVKYYLHVFACVFRVHILKTKTRGGNVLDISVHPIFPVDEITAGSLSRIKTDLINSGVDIDTRYEKTWKEAINFLLSDKGGMCKHGVLYIKSDDDRDVIDFVCKHFSPNASGTVTVFLNNGTPERDIQKNLLTKLHQSKITGNLPNEIWEKRHAIMIATQAICACFPEQRQTLLPILKTLTAASNTNLDAEGARTVFETLEKAWKPSAQ
jgi:hypothetical protein